MVSDQFHQWPSETHSFFPELLGHTKARSLVAMFATHPRLALLATVITPINMLLVKRTGKTVPGHLSIALSGVLWRFGEIWDDDLWKHGRFWNFTIIFFSLLSFVTSFFPWTNCSPCRLLDTFRDDSLRWVTMVWYKTMQWPKRMQSLSKSWAVYERCNPMWVRSRQDFVSIQIPEYKWHTYIHHTLSRFLVAWGQQDTLWRPDHAKPLCDVQEHTMPIMVLVLSRTTFRKDYQIKHEVPRELKAYQRRMVMRGGFPPLFIQCIYKNL